MFVVSMIGIEEIIWGKWWMILDQLWYVSRKQNFHMSLSGMWYHSLVEIIPTLYTCQHWRSLVEAKLGSGPTLVRKDFWSSGSILCYISPKPSAEKQRGPCTHRPIARFLFLLAACITQLLAGLVHRVALFSLCSLAAGPLLSRRLRHSLGAPSRIT